MTLTPYMELPFHQKQITVFAGMIFVQIIHNVFHAKSVKWNSYLFEPERLIDNNTGIFLLDLTFNLKHMEIFILHDFFNQMSNNIHPFKNHLCFLLHPRRVEMTFKVRWLMSWTHGPLETAKMNLYSNIIFENVAHHARQRSSPLIVPIQYFR